MNTKISLLALSVAASFISPSVLADDAAANGIEVIMVKGEKITRSLQETTSSVAVFTQSDIEESTSATLFDLFATTSNVSSTNGDYGFTIRGISNTGISGTSDVASVYVDGAVMPSISIRRSGLSIFDRYFD